MKERGISLIALIITIIVIIILAVVVIASAGDVIEDARFAKFEQEFGEYQQALQIAATQKKAELALQGITNVTDAQIYYMVAKGLDEVPETVTEAGKVASLTYDIQPASLAGTSYYEITPEYSQENGELGGVYAAENNPALNRTRPFYSSTEHVYVTNSGEAFTLPGYPRTKNGITQHYVNEKKYYTGEKAVETVTFTIKNGTPEIELWNQAVGSYTVPKGTTWQDFINSEEYNPTRTTHITEYIDEAGNPKDIEMKIFESDGNWINVLYPYYFDDSNYGISNGGAVGRWNDETDDFSEDFEVDTNDVFEDGEVYRIYEMGSN